MEESRVTRTSRVIKRAFLKQVSRAIGFKISEEQYWKGKPTIIGVRINEWRYDIHDHDDFVEMKNHIQKQLTKISFHFGCLFV